MPEISVKKIVWAIFTVLFLSVMGAVTGGIYLLNSNRQIAASWDSYRAANSARFQTLTQLRSALGYGGFIHDFKNMVLRGDASKVGVINEHLGAVFAAIDRYGTLQLNPQEREALAVIKEVVTNYRNKITETTLIIELGGNAEKTDHYARVDDMPAFKGLQVLEHFAENEDGHGLSIHRQRLLMLSHLRRDIGYGGVIHNFKNYILRGDAVYLERSREKAAAAREEIENLRAMGPTATERDALSRIDATLDLYMLALDKAEELKTRGLEARAIDAQVKINDSPAKAAFSVLDSNSVDRLGEHIQTVDDLLAYLNRFLYLGVFITLAIFILIAVLLFWLVRSGVLAPVNRLIREIRSMDPGSMESFRVEVPVGEFGMIADALNDMAGEIRKSNRHMQRTGEMLKRTNEQLQQKVREADEAREAAIVADQTKSRFIANVSHELRTPLNGVLGMSDLLLSSPLSDDQKELANMIRESGAIMHAQVNEILDFSSMEAGKLTVRREPMDLRRTVAMVTAMLSDKASQKGVFLKSVVAEDLSDWILSDEARVAQILINLVGNAVKFTESGTILISVRVDRKQEGDALLLEVSDTGIGIPPDDLDRIFDRFEQIDSSLTRKTEGTGLGLSIVASLCELLGGRITVKSEVGKGTSFTAILDYTPCSAPKEADAVERKASQPPLKILAVDDNRINAVLLKRMLTGEGHDVTTCENGEEAVQLVSEGRFDLVLMDVQMPVMDGIEATRRIRAMNGEIAATPIVGVTANVRKQDRQACYDAGMDAVIGKPVDKDILSRTIAELFAADFSKADVENTAH